MKVQSPSFPLWFRASLLFFALPGLSAQAADTTALYLWNNTSGGSQTWETSGNWTASNPGGGSTGAYPSQSQTGSNFDDAFIVGNGSASASITSYTATGTVYTGTFLAVTTGSFTTATTITLAGETFNWLDASLNGTTAGKLLTIDINGNVTTTNVSTGLEVENPSGAPVTTEEDADQFVGNKSVLDVNVGNGATFSTGTSSVSQGFQFNGASGSTFTILAGGTVNAVEHQNNFMGGLTAGDSFVVDGGLYEDSQSAVGTSFYGIAQNTGFSIGTGTLTIGSGGVAILNAVESNTGTATLNINGGSLTVRYNGDGMNFAGKTAANYTSAITENNASSGSPSTVVNNSTLNVGVYNNNENTTATAIYQGVTTVQIGNGVTGNSDSWTQNGATSVGNGMVGIMQVDATGVFNSHDVYLGGGPIAANGATAAVDLYGDTLTPSSGLAYSVNFDGSTYTFSKLTGAGYLVMNGGTMNVTNPTAGTTGTATAVDAGGSPGAGIVPSSQPGQQPYSGERIIFTSLTSSTGSTQLKTGVVYYVINGSSTNQFDVALTPGGTEILLTGYSAAQYQILPSALSIGNSISTGTGTVVLPGNLTMNSGTLTVDELDTNNTASGSGLENGQTAASSITFNGGTLILGSSNPTFTYASGNSPSNGPLSNLVVGNGNANGPAAVLQFASGMDGTSQANEQNIASTITLNNNSYWRGYGATLAPIVTSTPTSTVTISPGTVFGKGNILSTTSIAPSSNMTFQFQFNVNTVNGGPNFASISNSGNDVVNMNAGGGLTANLGKSNVFDIFINQTTLTLSNLNETFQGGLMDQTGNLTSQVAGATYDYFILGNGDGTSMTYDGQTYYSLAAFDAANSDNFAIQESVVDNNFAGGSEIQQFEIELNLASAAYFNGTSPNLSLAGSTDTDASSQVANTAGIGSTTNVFFSANRNTLTTAEIEGSPMTANSLTFGAGSGTNTGITLSSDSTADSLTIEATNANGNTAGNGITVDSGTDTISAPVVLGASQTWTTDATTQLTVSGNVSDGSSGFALTSTGGGVLILSGSNTYGGGTTVSGGTLLVSNTTAGGSATGTGSLTVSGGATIGGYGTSSGQGFNISGTGTLSAARANILVGMNSLTDTNTTKVLTLLGSTGVSTIANANLTFNLNARSVGQGTELNVGGTKVSFGTGVGSVQLTLNLQNQPAIIPANSGYVLIAGTGSTTDTNGVSGGQYTGLSLGAVTDLANGATETLITGSNLQLTFGSAIDNTWYGNGKSYLVLYQSSNVDDIMVEVVPEPGTWALMLGGLAMLVFISRAKSRAQVSGLPVGKKETSRQA